MKTRRSFLRTMAVGLVALAVIVAPAIAEELLGVISKVDVEGKKLTVVEKGADKDTIITVNNDTEIATGKGASDLEKLSKSVTKQLDAGKKGVFAKITHDKGVASKVLYNIGKKKAAN